LLSAGALCACSPSSRPEERVVHIYNWSDYLGKETIAQFETKTGIKVVYDTYDADETEIRSRLYRSAEVSASLERIRTRTWTRIKTAR
jgi:spermidine/putrescine-binding protein